MHEHEAFKFEMDNETAKQMLEAFAPEEIKRMPFDIQMQWLKQVVMAQKRKEEVVELLRGYREFIRENYVRLNPSIYDLEKWPMNPKLLEAIEKGDENEIKSHFKEVHPGIFAFELLPKDFCDLFIEELKNFDKFGDDQGLELQRPNSMNNYGAILDDFGFSDCMNGLLRKLMNPLSKIFYPHIGDTLDGHHGFIVSYEMGKDRKLSFHVDESEVTLNLCLGKEFEKGSLYFGGVRCLQHQQLEPKEEDNFTFNHTPGVAILHLGKHRHLANPILSGERHNLILWCRSSKIRSTEDNYQCHPWCGEYSTQT